MGFSIQPEILLLLSLPLLLVAAIVALCLRFLRGRARRNVLGSLGLAIAALVAFLWYFLAGPGRYAEFEDIQARFRAIPGVKLLEARGHEDVTFEIDGFTIDAEGRGVIAFGSLGRDSFKYADHLPILKICDHEVIVVTEGYIGVYRAETKEPVWSTGWGGGIDVGPEGPFARFFPFLLSNVQSVLDRHEEICRELASWPIQPEYGTFEDEDGVHYYYAVKDPLLNEDWIYPSELKEGESGADGR